MVSHQSTTIIGKCQRRNSLQIHKAAMVEMVPEFIWRGSSVEFGGDGVMTRGRPGRMMGRKRHRHRPMVLRLALAALLIAHGFPAPGQTVAEPAGSSVLRQLAPLSPDGD